MAEDYDSLLEKRWSRFFGVRIEMKESMDMLFFSGRRDRI